MLTAFERAKRVFDEAEKLNMDACRPNERMVAEAIRDAEFDTLMNPAEVAEQHGMGFRIEYVAKTDGETITHKKVK
jgi:hypothetical protein